MISKKKAFHRNSECFSFHNHHRLAIFGGAIFIFRLQISLQTAKKNAILHTFQANGGAIEPFAPPLATLLGRPILRTCDMPIHICDCETATCLVQIAKSSLNLWREKWGWIEFEI